MQYRTNTINCFCDDAATEQLILKSIYHRRTKYINNKCHIRQTVKNNQLEIRHTSGKQLTIMLTKLLTREKFKDNRNLINLF